MSNLINKIKYPMKMIFEGIKRLLFLGVLLISVFYLLPLLNKPFFSEYFPDEKLTAIYIAYFSVAMGMLGNVLFTNINRGNSDDDRKLRDKKELVESIHKNISNYIACIKSYNVNENELTTSHLKEAIEIQYYLILKLDKSNLDKNNTDHKQKISKILDIISFINKNITSLSKKKLNKKCDELMEATTEYIAFVGIKKF
jgi:hypothetical protein